MRPCPPVKCALRCFQHPSQMRQPRQPHQPHLPQRRLRVLRRRPGCFGGPVCLACLELLWTRRGRCRGSARGARFKMSVVPRPARHVGPPTQTEHAATQLRFLRRCACTPASIPVQHNTPPQAQSQAWQHRGRASAARSRTHRRHSAVRCVVSQTFRIDRNKQPRDFPRRALRSPTAGSPPLQGPSSPLHRTISPSTTLFKRGTNPGSSLSQTSLPPNWQDVNHRMRMRCMCFCFMLQPANRAHATSCARGLIPACEARNTDRLWAQENTLPKDRMLHFGTAVTLSSSSCVWSMPSLRCTSKRGSWSAAITATLCRSATLPPKSLRATDANDGLKEGRHAGLALF
eukprot:m.322765 g.322765  ORF g.322765 m.322765 type:complete len:345 (+) comp19719_c11_seq2:86-1120(+)